MASAPGRARHRRPLHALRRAGDRGLHRRRRPLHGPDRRDSLRAADDRRRRRARREAGVKIVNTSGFEALPPDLLVLLAAETARERWSEELATADLDAVLPIAGGGQALRHDLRRHLQSLAEIARRSRSAALAADSAAFDRRRGATRSRSATSARSRSRPRFNAQGDVIVPMIPSPLINPAVVHRTAALLAAEEDRVFTPFRYREGVAIAGSTARCPCASPAGARSPAPGDDPSRWSGGPGPRPHRTRLRKSLPPPASGRPGRKWRTGPGDDRQRQDGRRPLRPRRPRGRGPARLPDHRQDARRGRDAARRGRRDPEAQRLPHPGGGDRHRELDRFRHAGARIQVSS